MVALRLAKCRLVAALAPLIRAPPRDVSFAEHLYRQWNGEPERHSKADQINLSPVFLLAVLQPGHPISENPQILRQDLRPRVVLKVFFPRRPCIVWTFGPAHHAAKPP